MDDKEFAYLEYLALARITAIQEANALMNGATHHAAFEAVRFARDLHECISELIAASEDKRCMSRLVTVENKIGFLLDQAASALPFFPLL